MLLPSLSCRRYFLRARSDFQDLCCMFGSNASAHKITFHLGQASFAWLLPLVMEVNSALVQFLLWRCVLFPKLGLSLGVPLRGHDAHMLQMASSVHSSALLSSVRVYLVHLLSLYFLPVSLPILNDRDCGARPRHSRNSSSSPSRIQRPKPAGPGRTRSPRPGTVSKPT